MDFELEMACFIGGPPTALGERITAKQAEERIFGFVLMNDWSGKYMKPVACAEHTHAHIHTDKSKNWLLVYYLLVLCYFAKVCNEIFRYTTRNILSNQQHQKF